MDILADVAGSICGVYLIKLLNKEEKQMQIDFHHETIYALARIAGFSKED